MRSFIIDRKTGFINKNPLHPIVIRDFRGKMFYSTEGLRPVEKFNLPQGSYFIEKGDFSRALKPVSYKIVKMPKPERRFLPPHDFDIYFDENPNKCTIRWNFKEIVYDNALKQADLPTLFFMLYHEHGHALYKTEKFADRFARNMMIRRGYNPSQVGKAPLLSLSSRQIKRKKHVINSLI